MGEPSTPGRSAGRHVDSFLDESHRIIRYWSRRPAHVATSSTSVQGPSSRHGKSTSAGGGGRQPAKQRRVWMVWIFSVSTVSHASAVHQSGHPPRRVVLDSAGRGRGEQNRGSLAWLNPPWSCRPNEIPLAFGSGCACCGCRASVTHPSAVICRNGMAGVAWMNQRRAGQARPGQRARERPKDCSGRLMRGRPPIHVPSPGRPAARNSSGGGTGREGRGTRPVNPPTAPTAWERPRRSLGDGAGTRAVARSAS